MLKFDTKSLRMELVPSVDTLGVDFRGESMFKTRGKDAKSLVDHMTSINIDSKSQRVINTPIICSIGSASRDVNVLVKLLETGMNVARLNFSHGSHAYHLQTIDNINKAVEKHSRKIGLQYPLGIAVELKGPKIQTGLFEGADITEVELKKGGILKLTTDKAYEVKGNSEIVYVDYLNISKVVKVGGRIFLDHGSIALTINDLGLSFVSCTVDNGGMLANQKSVQLPDTVLDLPALTNKDREDLLFAVANSIDFIFAPCVRTAATINELRYILGDKGKHILVFAKIENQHGVHHVNDIIAVSDGVIVSRADLGTDMPYEAVVTAQKTIIARCNKLGVPVICSTQVLESMVRRPRPTIAEVNDTGNAILNGVDCIMLSGETETGKYPVESLQKLVAICKQAESALWVQQKYNELCSIADETASALEILAMATVRASILCRAAGIIVVTKSGGSAHAVSKYRPRCPIITVTRYMDIARKNQVYRGQLPIHYAEKPLPDWSEETEARVNFGLKFGLNSGFIKIGDHVIILTGWKKGSLFTNTMRIMCVSPNRALQEVLDH